MNSCTGSVPNEEEFNRDREEYYECNYQLITKTLESMPNNFYFDAIEMLPIQEVQTSIIKALYARNTFSVHKACN